MSAHSLYRRLVTLRDDASGAGRSTSTPPLPKPTPSFARRHPFYTAFGLLAALSLFSTFWPLSAAVTLGLVAVRVTGLDVRAARAASGVARRVWRLVRHEAPPPEPQGPQPSLHGPAKAGPQQPARIRARALRDVARVEGSPRRREPVGAAGHDRDTVGL
jgi:hypothetical protein